MQDWPELDWYKCHPFIEEWRQQDINSCFSTVTSLNAKWDINVNNPITLSKVHEVVGQYLTLLVRHVKTTCKKEKLPRSREIVEARFNLTHTEEQIILNSFNKTLHA